MTDVLNDQQTFEQAIMSSWTGDQKSYVLFSSPTCGPCGMVKRVLEKIEDANPTLSVSYVNVFHATAAASDTKIRAVPTLVKFENGQETARIVGAADEAKLKAFFGL